MSTLLSIVFGIVNTLLLFFLLALLGRLALDWIQVFARDWEPNRQIRVVAGAIYTVTDPPIRAVRRVVPNLRLGSIQLDLSFMLVFFVTYVLYNLTRV